MMWRQLSTFFFVMSASVASAQPISLASAWQAAQTQDPTLQAAISEREAGQTERALGRAALLPQISANLGRTRIHGHLETPDAQDNIVRQDLDYTSKVNEINLQQSLFDWGRITGYRQGHARADQALATFDVQANDASERLINRYFQLLLAQQQLSLSAQNVQASDQHIEIAQHHFRSGEGTITEVHEAQARRDIAYAQWLNAQDNLTVARRELQEMIGVEPEQVLGLQEKINPVGLEPHDLASWMQMALTRNAQIRVATENLRVSALEIQRAFSGHLPTATLTGSLRKTTAESISTRNQDSSTRSLGISIQVPVFAGGATQAQVRQAQYGRDRSSHELDATREEIAVEVTRQYQGVLSGAQKINAYQKAVQSNELALKAAERGYQGGVRSISDILDAQDRLYQSQLDLTRTRLEYVMARLMLAAVADGLTGSLIEQTTQQFFSHKPIPVKL
ncbi:TolC family outer membrane protein [Paenalcaligenes hominis]|uniref:TolC family outer membrane protein n=1 Tax=Paenalcaligenes hominis TaxID=643674 RepID=UPI003524A5BF